MKFLAEFRDPERVRHCVAELRRVTTRRWTVMEICGGQTHAIVRHGLDQLLPPGIKLVHGPGCPVCVTPIEEIDQAIAVSLLPGVALCSFGDMLRVPGTSSDLLQARAAGADVRVVYSPLDAVELAIQEPDRDVVFFAVGFETTAPASAAAIERATQLGLRNFSVLSSHVRVPPAMEAILTSDECEIDGFLAAGHVCSVMGSAEYQPLCERYQVPIVITGFEPLDILQGLLACVEQLEARAATGAPVRVENQYTRAVRESGNVHAQSLVSRVFREAPRNWRGLGNIEGSGLELREDYAQLDAKRRPALEVRTADLPHGKELASPCIAGRVLRGLARPADCPCFASECTPESPLGAPMVSSEGACAAYFQHRARSSHGAE
ncbi:MAG: hydrogenase formation protein HypD [Polyangiaceae bacterium]